MPDQPLLIVLGGPTASGKTGLAIEVARHFGTEILSADSRQFYREMRIGNARPSPEELAAVPHHFIADRSLDAPLTAGTFAAKALEVLARLFTTHETAVLAGGSGLYIRALCEGLDEFPAVTEAARTRVQGIVEAAGLAGLQAEVARLDPEYFATVDRQNGRRLERALRVCFTEGKPYSSYLGKIPKRPFRPVYLQPAIGREPLYARINDRVDRMLRHGLEQEARALFPRRGQPVLETVGYQEWWPCFNGEYDRDRAVELIKRNSRRYAKRQVTWFREYAPVVGLPAVIRACARRDAE
ncbi:tRNA (adenosine(37)-N6)-dimethylallyltransferase MiaA [Lewinella sp. IMCC34183]|uniref:tRNA (adenosine(37)-N6)-dimethylallyltransferase MiaA n=1 Tax=Lewinella sp. IMCC34183 TaxID=2248762 RepID=UPI000E22C83A|nr:tRNA (adenosine(37)-N6)-dimethylallyltransferase MiaA [Lewinella sp. IMCC34183]